MINENRLFKLIPYFFSKPDKVFYEIAQNAYRANATKLDITVAGGKLRASDNGSGASHAEPLFVLADTGWDDESVNQQMPAGWGIYFLVAVASRITFRSLFGSITLDCKRFLEDKAYRESVIGKVNRADTEEGFHIEAELKSNISLNPSQAGLGFFPLDITVNGEAVKKRTTDRESSTVITSSYKGNHVQIYRGMFNVTNMSNTDIACIWYGIPIKTHNDDILINVTQGTPMTPVLPYREAIKDDERLHEFLAWTRGIVAEHCIGYINDPANTDHYELQPRMKFLANCGTQEELDRIDRFYCRQEQPYHRLKICFSGMPSEKIIDRAEYVESEHLELTINGKRTDYENTEYSLFLPDKALIQRTLPVNTPSWVKIHQKAVQISIKTKGKPYTGMYEWHNSAITCKGKDIKVLGLIEYYDNGTVYYETSPDNFDEIQKTVFEKVVYSEDSNTYDSQESDFDDSVSQDIMNIRRSYSLTKILDGFYTANINPWDITSILYRKKNRTITVTTEKKVEAKQGRRKGAMTVKREKHVLRVA